MTAKYNYKVVKGFMSESAINDMARDNWEFINVVTIKYSPYYYYYFKRDSSVLSRWEERLKDLQFTNPILKGEK